ncbi:MAG: hypothetical protein IPN29_06125 [Saprospiraceae bacterium]|nr:hypothetical protein [Saprospiraceae bacterium]
MPDVVFKRLETPRGFEAAYELMVKQPLDHQSPEKGSFYQRVFLTHRGFSLPTLLITEGYDRPANRIYELTDMLQGNQVQVEHRYFGKSMPDSLDYQYLTLENVTADLHHITQLLKTIYPTDWISTGISKGGQTTIFYRYFYPDDVDASVPYVAPLNTSLEDERIYQFLDTVGTEHCRERIFRFQKKMLETRDQSLQKLKWYSKGAGLTYTYLSLEQAFEYSVLEYAFSFWQWGTSCADMPYVDMNHDSLLKHLIRVSDPGFFSDRDMQKYATHYHQAATQMGYYGYDISPFRKHLKAIDTAHNPSAIFVPGKMATVFDATLSLKTAEWLKEQGDRFIYINGAMDTWSATAVRPQEGRNALWYFLPGKDHAKARIKNLSGEEQARIVATLQQWLREIP